MLNVLCFLNKPLSDNEGNKNYFTYLENCLTSLVFGISVLNGMVTEIEYRDIKINRRIIIFQLWDSLDNEILMTPIPPEFSELQVKIVCRDCHEVGIFFRA